jgi:hypothetical protein
MGALLPLALVSRGKPYKLTRNFKKYANNFKEDAPAINAFPRENPRTY